MDKTRHHLEVLINMNFLAVLAVLLFGAFSSVKCNTANPCKLSDPSCLKQTVAKMYSEVMEMDSSTGTENLDPMFQDIIEGKLSVVKYELIDTTVKGLKKCVVENVKLSPQLSLYIELICPRISIYGKYHINGKVAMLPVKGSGDFRIETKKFQIKLELGLKKVTAEDGQSYITVEDFKQTAEPLEKMRFNFRNLFNGKNVLLSDVLHTYANTHWKEFSVEVHDPVLDASILKVVKNVNYYFGVKSMNELGIVL